MITTTTTTTHIGQVLMNSNMKNDRRTQVVKQ